MRLLFSLAIILFAKLSIAQAEDSIPVSQKDSSVKRNDRLSFWTDFSLNYSYRKVSSSTYPEMIACRNKHESPVLLPQFTFFLCDSITRKFQFTFGIRLLKTGFNLKEDLTLNDTIDHEYGAACNVYGMWDPYRGALWEAFTDPRYNFLIIGYHPVHATINIGINYSYLDFPAEIRFSFSHRRNSFFIASGVSMSYLLRQRIVESFQYENGDYGSNTLRESHAAYLKKFNSFLLADIGWRHWLKEKKFSFELHSGIQQQLFDNFNHHSSYVSGYHEKHFGYTLGITTYYFIEKRKHS
jgi:hypothetical protein